MSHIALDEVIRRIHDLPSLPAVVAELLSSMAQEDVDLHYLSGRIALDQALTAKTLRLANSSFYGMPSKVNSIQQAMSVLGCTACGRWSWRAASSAPCHRPAGSARFRPVLAPGDCHGRMGARAGPSSAPEPDTAFTAGLLHNLGTLVLATRFPNSGQCQWRSDMRCQRGACRAGRVRRRHSRQRAGRPLAKFPRRSRMPSAISTAPPSRLAQAVGLAHAGHPTTAQRTGWRRRSTTRSASSPKTAR
jgi:hypothetical protein